MTGLAQGQQHHRGPIRRFDAVAGGPIWWACHFGGSYWLAPRACTWGTEIGLHLLTVAMLALIGRAFLSGLQLLRAGRAADGDLGAHRDVYIGWLGMALAIFFGSVTVAEWIPVLFIDPCS